LLKQHHQHHQHQTQPTQPPNHTPPQTKTSLFLRKLKDTLKLPVLALVDADPYGLKILSVYMKVG
jgi:hypothetical protein